MIKKLCLLIILLVVLSVSATAQTPISGLPSATSAGDSDVLAGVQSATTKKFPVSVLFAAPRTMDRLTIAPATVLFNLAGDTLGVGQIIPHSSNVTIATGKFYDHARLSRTDGNYNVFDIQGTGVVAGLNFALQSHTTSGASSNLYGVIGTVSNKSAGSAKAIYGRTVLEAGATGVGVAGVFALSAQPNTTAWILQVAGTDNVDIVQYIHADNGVSADIADGIVFDQKVRIEANGAFLKAFQTLGHNGDFLHYMTQAGATLFKVDKDGIVAGIGSGLTSLNASNLGSGTIPDGRFPATLPAASGVNLTNLNASNLASGTVPLARIVGLTNTEIAGGAAIAYSKLNLSGSIVNADINASAGIVYSKLNLSNSIVAGDITSNAVTTAKISDDQVTYAKIQNVSATNRLLGRSTAGAGDVEEITVGGDLSQSGSTFTIVNDAVTDAKLRNSAALSVIGRASNSTGDPADIAAGAAYNILRRDNANALAFGSIDLSQSGAVGSSVLGIGNGGTGVAVFNATRVYNSANISLSNGTTTVLTFDSERFDNNALHSTSSNTSRLTVPSGGAGTYIITANVSFDANATGLRQIFFQVNGGAIIALKQINNAGAVVTEIDLSTIYKLSDGDYVEVYAAQFSGGSLNISSIGNRSPEFAMARIGN